MAAGEWPCVAKSLKGVILDMCGVLYDSGEGDGVAIPESIKAVQRYTLKCYNITRNTRDFLNEQIMSTPVACSLWCNEHEVFAAV